MVWDDAISGVLPWLVGRIVRDRSARAAAARDAGGADGLRARDECAHRCTGGADPAGARDPRRDRSQRVGDGDPVRRRPDRDGRRSGPRRGGTEGGRARRPGGAGGAPAPARGARRPRGACASWRRSRTRRPRRTGDGPAPPGWRRRPRSKATLAVSPGLSLCAYRVVQEALTNTIKHAGGARTGRGALGAMPSSSKSSTTGRRRPAVAGRRRGTGSSGCASGSTARRQRGGRPGAGRGASPCARRFRWRTQDARDRRARPSCARSTSDPSMRSPAAADALDLVLEATLENGIPRTLPRRPLWPAVLVGALVAVRRSRPGAAVIGCSLVALAQEPFHGQLFSTLDSSSALGCRSRCAPMARARGSTRGELRIRPARPPLHCWS